MNNRNKRVVIADDNEELCDLVKDILRGMGFEADSVHNGYELITYLETHNPSVIILDLLMPDKDGISIFDTIRQLSEYTRIIVYTGYQEYEGSVYARKADRFLVKGNDIDHLIKAVEELA